jgi:histidyl-tRNA synthetase
MSALGGPELPGIGFGIGTDRTLLARQAEGLPDLGPPAVDVYGVALGDAAHRSVTALVDRLRAAGVRADRSFGGRGLKGAMKAADRSGARWAAIVGDAEAAAGTVQMKDLRTGRQSEVRLDEVPAFVAVHGSEDVDDAAHP